ncbi:MAG TPA: type VI secretion system baseplate subunit TssK [Bryobacteraceae bacterium]|nr:type VI secretion system baseplate subunit TssK [Bryobacteraceae bacterium]
MKTLSRVVWSEGMHLGPHHFQHQSRYFEDVIHFTTTNLWFADYGIAGCQFDADALRNGTLSLIHARGIFPDGLSFHMPETEPLPPPRRMAELFPPMRDSVDVLLTVPTRSERGAICALTPDEIGPGVRYIAEPVVRPDENTGIDEKPVLVGRKNIELKLDTEVDDSTVRLPVGRVRRDGSGNFILDQSFIPPCLRVNASDRLMILLRRIVEMLEEKARTVVKPKELAAGTTSGFSAQGISNAWFLHCVNSSVGPLRHLCFSKKPHPEEVFVELSRLAGALCTFGLDSHPSSLPTYTHDKLAECMEALEYHIRTHLELVVPSNCVPIVLKAAARYFWEGEITDQRVLSRSRWIFAIHTKRIGEAELIESTPRLVKICSREFLPKLVSRALPGLRLSHMPVPPPAVSPRLETQYFAVDKAGPCWEHMVTTRQLSIYVPGELPEPEVELMVVLE